MFIYHCCHTNSVRYDVSVEISFPFAQFIPHGWVSSSKLELCIRWESWIARCQLWHCRDITMWGYDFCSCFEFKICIAMLFRSSAFWRYPFFVDTHARLSVQELTIFYLLTSLMVRHIDFSFTSPFLYIIFQDFKESRRTQPFVIFVLIFAYTFSIYLWFVLYEIMDHESTFPKFKYNNHFFLTVNQYLLCLHSDRSRQESAYCLSNSVLSVVHCHSVMLQYYHDIVSR